MHRLIIMRHAQAASFAEGGDKARPLTQEGIVQAKKAGEHLRTIGIEWVLCSSAIRTRQTLENLALSRLDGSPHVDFMDSLYSGGLSTLCQRISEIDDTINTLLVVGHAPTIPALASQLSWNESHRDADRLRCFYPTATFSEFTLDKSWSAFVEGDLSDLDTHVVRTWHP